MHDMTKGICALCGHDQIIQAWPWEHGGGNSTYNLAATQTTSRWGKVTTHGDFVAYICRRCGFTMWFANNPAEIPIGPEHGTQLVARA